MTDEKLIAYLQDTYKIGYEAFESSRIEAAQLWEYYHNHQYTPDQLATLANRGQPAETFNVIKLFSRMMLGYYSTVINNIQPLPVGFEDVPKAALLGDVISYILRDNSFSSLGDEVKLSGLISGLMCVYLDVVPTGEKDQFGRPRYKIVIEAVPERELVIDPASRKEDYSDARYIHRFKWVDEAAVIKLWGKKVLDTMQEHYNFTQKTDAEFDAQGRQIEQGLYKVHNNYLIVHSVITDEDDKVWSVHWHNDVILEKTELTYKAVRFPYRVVKVHTAATEYYGVFREVLESQKAINQALIKLQLMVNTQKVFVEDGAVEDLALFRGAVNRVSAVIPVIDLNGIKVENMSRDVLDQYTIIDKAFDRIQRILGINDSFLGMAFASDSGRKVKLQQNASVVAMRYFSGRVETFYRLLGWDLTGLIQQYYSAHQVFRIADEATGHRWIEINKPIEVFKGQFDPQGQPIKEPEFEEVLDPASGEPMEDEEGNYIIAPIPTEESELSFANVDIEIVSNAYNDEDEKNQLFLEQVISGPLGQMLASVNPAGYFKTAGLSMKSIKTRNAIDIAKIFEETASMLSGNPEAQTEVSQIAQNLPGQGGGPRSETLNLPQNTNEGA